MEKSERVQLPLQYKLSAELFGWVRCAPGWLGDSHSHPFWELVAEKTVSGCRFTVIPPDTAHCFRNAAAGECLLLYAGFSFDCGASSVGAWQQRMLLYLSAGENPFSALAQRAWLGGEQPDALAGELILALHELLIFCRLRLREDGGEGVAGQVAEYIRRNPHRTLTVEEIAASFYLSPKYLGGIFRLRFGMGILQYQRKIKMEAAMLRLQEPTLTVQQIADSLGFENAQYFSGVFKAYYGKPPSFFRPEAKNS